MHISSVLPFVTKSIHQKPKTPSLGREKTDILGCCPAEGPPCHALSTAEPAWSAAIWGEQASVRAPSCFVSDSRFQSQTSETSGTAQRFRSRGDKLRDVMHCLPWTGSHVLTHYLAHSCWWTSWHEKGIVPWYVASKDTGALLRCRW